MALFTSTTVDSLKKKSGSIVSVFTRTVQELTDVNNEIQKLSEEKQAEKARLQAELNDLGEQQFENTKVIDKINRIFE